MVPVGVEIEVIHNLGQAVSQIDGSRHEVPGEWGSRRSIIGRSAALSAKSGRQVWTGDALDNPMCPLVAQETAEFQSNSVSSAYAIVDPTSDEQLNREDVGPVLLTKERCAGVLGC